MADIGKKIKHIREHFGYTVNEMAGFLDINPRTLGSYERNEAKPSLDSLEKIANKCKINLNWLITGKGEMLLLKNRQDDDSLIVKLKKGETIKIFYKDED